MLNDPIFLAAAAAAFVVLGILMFGIGAFAKGGDFGRRHSNRLMRWRIIAQFIAVLLILLLVWLHQGG